MDELSLARPKMTLDLSVRPLLGILKGIAVFVCIIRILCLINTQIAGKLSKLGCKS